MATMREKLKAVQPNAINIQYDKDQKCPDCRAKSMLSYQFASDLKRDRGEGVEQCGFYCCNCGWGNGGTRAKKAKRGV
jgi:hypothetical protein